MQLNTLVAGLSEMLARTVGEGIKVETVSGAGLWTTFADINQIELVVEDEAGVREYAVSALAILATTRSRPRCDRSIAPAGNRESRRSAVY